MQLERWTLFIDMLGYGQINGSIENRDQAVAFLAFMKSNVALFKDQDSDDVKAMYARQQFNLYKYYDVKVLFVSDSIMISYYPREVNEVITEKQRNLHSANALFIILQRLQILIYNCMNEKNILLRGGVSNKFSLIDDQFAVGAGIIEAYQLESKKAKFPRIVLSNDIIENQVLFTAVRYLSLFIYQMENILVVDDDGIYYFDYLGFNIRCALQGGKNVQNLAIYDAFIMRHKETVEFHIEKTRKLIEKIETADSVDQQALIEQNRVLDKYMWLKGYHNTKISTLNNPQLEERFHIN